LKLFSAFCAFSTLILFLASADGSSIFVTDLQGLTPIFSFNGEEVCTFVSCGLSPIAGYKVSNVSSVYTSLDPTLSIVNFGMVQDNFVSGVQSLQFNNLEHSFIINGPLGGGTDVPEPSTFALLLVALFGYLSYMWPSVRAYSPIFPSSCLNLASPRSGSQTGSTLRKISCQVRSRYALSKYAKALSSSPDAA
jgi:hypothetical protein